MQDHAARPPPVSLYNAPFQEHNQRFIYALWTVRSFWRLGGLLGLVEQRVPGARTNHTAHRGQVPLPLERDDGVPGLWAEVAIHRQRRPGHAPGVEPLLDHD